jgi:hypothetical protein
MLEHFRARLCSSNDPPYALRLVLESRQPSLLSRLRIPCAFTSLHEARDCLDDLLQWICNEIRRPIRNPVIHSDLKVVVEELSSHWASALDGAIVGQCTKQTFHRQVRTVMLLKAAHRTSLLII